MTATVEAPAKRGRKAGSTNGASDLDLMRCYVVWGKRTDGKDDFAARGRIGAAIAQAGKMHATGDYAQVRVFKTRSSVIEYDAADDQN